MEAVTFMHSKGKAHRDLKLENLLFDFDTMVIKVIDFGFGVSTKADERLEKYCGTPHYMDPDICKK